jgi:hypothetical protein
MDAEAATFDHENGRSAGKRDDRIEIDGKPINAAVHKSCNSARGSTRAPYLFQVTVTLVVVVAPIVPNVLPPQQIQLELLPEGDAW